jgi:hypothetical protein
MAWYDNGRKILALATIATGMSLGEIAIAAPKNQILEADVHACPIEGLTDCVTISQQTSAQTKQVTETTPPSLPVPIEPFLGEPVWIEPIEAIPFDPIFIDQLEPPPLRPLPLDSSHWGDPSAPLHEPPIYHIVLVDLIDTATEAEIEALIADGEASIVSIPGVLAVDIGLKLRDDRDVHIRDYDLGVYVKLDSTALDAYGAHPNHQAFIERQRHLWSSIRVIDFSGSAPNTPWNDCQY